MVMRGGGRSREIQRLQAAQQGGQATARQQQRLDYLQDNRGAGRRPQGPQTGGPLQQAMGAGGQDAMRTQQPYQGGQMSNGGTTWDGQAPMSMGGGQSGQAYGDSMKKDPTFAGSREEAMAAYRASGQQGDPNNQSGDLKMQPGQVPQEMLDQMGPLTRQNDPGFARPGMAPPMQRPTPGGEAMDPYAVARPGAQGPDYFRGQGMDNRRFNKPGYQAPQQPVQNDYFRGGGMDNGRFNKPGYQAPPRQVQGNQLRGGGVDNGRFARPRPNPKNFKTLPGVLAQPPR